MEYFFPTLKTDRKREILDYKEKGYDFLNGENNYQYIRNIDVVYRGKNYKLHVRVDNEIRFHLTNDGYNIYLTVEDIYSLLVEACSVIDKDIVRKNLESIIDDTEKEILELKYLGIGYHLEFPKLVLPEEDISIFDSDIKISYIELILIIILIHNKSNYYFMYKKDEVLNKHKNGFIRLIIALITREKSSILTDKGWKFNSILRKYVLVNTQKKEDDKYYLKYYLTKEEFENIMS